MEEHLTHLLSGYCWGSLEGDHESALGLDHWPAAKMQAFINIIANDTFKQ